MAVKIAEACAYVLPPVLGFTTLGVLWEGVCNLFLKSFSTDTTYSWRSVSELYFCNV